MHESTCWCALALQVMALGHPVIVVQCPGVSMRLGPVLPVDEVVDQVVGVLDKLGVEQACVIGHSYGKGPSIAACEAGFNAPCDSGSASRVV